MSLNRTEKNWRDVQDVLARFHGHDHLMALALLQLIEREKVRVLNNYRKTHNEPLLPTDPPKLPGDRDFGEWLIEVPKEWYSVTGKDKS